MTQTIIPSGVKQERVIPSGAKRSRGISRCPVQEIPRLYSTPLHFVPFPFDYAQGRLLGMTTKENAECKKAVTST